MTRVVNQLQFRPSYNSFKINNILDTSLLVKYNEGWYDDINRFNSQGLNIYNLNPVLGNSNLTEVGAKLINWYREMIGLHVDWNQPISTSISQNIKYINYDALDSAVTSADYITKMFTNQKTQLTTMWGWMTDAEAKRYKYIVFTDKNKNKYQIPIRTKGTSNYFVLWGFGQRWF